MRERELERVPGNYFGESSLFFNERFLGVSGFDILGPASVIERDFGWVWGSGVACRGLPNLVVALGRLGVWH